MRLSAALVFALGMVAQLTIALPDANEKELINDLEANNLTGDDATRVGILVRLAERAGAERAGSDPQEKKRKKKQKGMGKQNKEKVVPVGYNVTKIGEGLTVTKAHYGNYTSEFVGNWSQHAHCLMQCNLEYPDPCTSLEGGNCTCVAMNDRQYGRTTGVCAVKGVDLGSNKYGGNDAWLPQGALLQRPKPK